MRQKLSGKIILAIILCIFTTVFALSIISIEFTENYGKNLILRQTNSYVRSMESEFEWRIKRLKEIDEMFRIVNEGGGFNRERISDIFDQKKESDSDFGAILDASGEVVWRTDNFDKSDFEIAQLNKTYEGMISTDSGLSLVNVNVSADQTVSILGMRLDSNVWLDELKEETGVEYSVFNGKTRYATTVVDEKGNRSVGTDMSDKVAEQVIRNGQDYSGEAEIFGQKHYVAYCPMTDINGRVVGALFSGVSSAETDQYTSRMILALTLSAAGIGAVVIIISTLILLKTVIHPIFSAIKAGLNIADNLNQGVLSNSIEGLQLSNDEMGEFVKQLNATTYNLSCYLIDMKRVLSSMAEGDFTAKPQMDYIGEFAEIERSFGRISEGMSEIIGDINVSSRNVLKGSTDISDGSRGLADGSTKQAAAIEELSASLNEITKKVQTTAENAAEAGRISESTSQKIAAQNTVVQDMLAAMKEIEKESDEIGKIIKAIDEIAFQTNILALNAAVEASRAGEAGKGFAVVADEVRNLAAKSAESAKQTGALINATISAVQKGNAIANQTAETMKEVTEYTSETNRYISDIAGTSAGQANSIEQIKVSIEEISKVVQQNSATAEQTASACASLNTEASGLASRIELLKVNS